MDRFDFIDLLDDIKCTSNKTTADLSYDMHIPWGAVRRLEEGRTNFGIDSILKYIKCLDHHIQLTNLSNNVYHIPKYDDLIVWLKETRREKFTKFSQRSLAQNIGCSYVNIANIETHKSVMSIDTFLKLTTLFVTNIKIVENNEQNS